MTRLGVASATTLIGFSSLIGVVAYKITTQGSGIPTHCTYQGAGAELPDPQCTPGATAKGFTTAMLCQFHDPIRPPLSYTEPLKYKLMKAYGYINGTSARGYELDHLIPLELGGDPTSVKNLWPEPHPTSYTKDHVENKLHSEMCAGKITLRHARYIMRHDWRLGE